MNRSPSSLGSTAAGLAAVTVLSALVLAPTSPARGQEGSAASEPPAVDAFTERLECELVLREVWQGDLAMTDYYPLDYVMSSGREVSASRCPGGKGSDDGRLVTFERVDGEHVVGREEEPGEPARLESALEGAVVAFGGPDGPQLVEGRSAAEPWIAGLRDAFGRSAFGPPEDLGAEPGWSLRDAEALALFDVTGPLGRELEDMMEPQRTVILLGAPFELRALLAGDDAPTAKLELSRAERNDGGPADEPLDLALKANGVSDLRPRLLHVAELAGDLASWEGTTKLEATWTFEAEGTALWDASRSALHDIELEGELVISAELTYQPTNSVLSPNTFVLDIAGTVTFVSDHWRK